MKNKTDPLPEFRLPPLPEVDLKLKGSTPPPAEKNTNVKVSKPKKLPGAVGNAPKRKSKSKGKKK